MSNNLYFVITYFFNKPFGIYLHVTSLICGISNESDCHSYNYNICNVIRMKNAMYMVILSEIDTKTAFEDAKKTFTWWRL